MIRITKLLAARLLQLLLVLIVVSAMLIGSLRLLTPAVGYYRAELEQWASQLVQRPVRIGGLSASWQGLGPELVLSSVEIDVPGAAHNTLKLAEIRVNLAVLESLRKLTLKTRQVVLSRVSLLATRNPDGSFTIGGLDAFSGGSGSSAGLFALPSRIRLEESEITFDDRLAGTAPQQFRNVNAQLRNAGSRHQLEANLPFPGGGELELKADLRRDTGGAEGWRAVVYLKGREIALASLLRAGVVQGYTPAAGSLDLELWSDWSDGRFQRTQGRGEITRLLFRREAIWDTAAQELEVDRLGGSFLWTPQPGGWKLDVKDFAFVRNGSAWPGSDFSLSAHIGEDRGMQLLAGADFMRVEDVAAVAGMFLPQQPEIAQALQTIAPVGELHELRFEWFDNVERQTAWSLQGRFESLTTQPWKRVPGVQELEAHFWVSQDAGSLLLDSHSTVLHFPGLFRDPLELKSLRGQISWRRGEDGGWRLQTPDLAAVTKDIRTNTRLLLEIPGQKEKSAFMDLQTDFSDGLAINAHRYYPVGIMPDAVVAWLDRGIVDGRVISGSALVRGPLHDFPFHKTHNGVFEVFFHTDNMTIDYAPGWPRLTDVAAEVRFLQNGFEFEATRGAIFDSRLQQVKGGIADFRAAPFELQGSVQGALYNNLRLLRESPLAGEFALFTEGMDAEGEAVTQLDLTIPIRPDQQFNLDGTLGFSENSLHLKAWQLPLTDIVGSLNFSHRDISAVGLKAKALGSDIVLDIESLPKPNKVTRITARTKSSSRQLALRFPELDFTPLQGESALTLHLDIPHRLASGQEAPSILISSDLTGMEIGLPAPFGKRADEARAFTLSADFPESRDSKVYIEYGPLLHLALSLETAAGRDKTFKRGALQLGGAPARLPADEGFEIGGKLKLLDLTAWSGLLQSQRGPQRSPPLNKLELDVERVTAGDFGLDHVSLSLVRKNGRLGGQLASRQAEGHIELPDDIQQTPVNVRLQRLSLHYAPDKQEKPQRGSSNVIDPTTLPAFDLKVERTEVNNQDYGQLALLSRRIPAGQQLQRFSLDAKQLQLTASGDWTQAGPERQHTRLQFTLATESLGKLLDDLGYQHYIDRAPAELECQVDWPDSPVGFRTEILNGRVGLQLEKGQFLNVDPGIGRVFGLLNIAALQRRLTLDFSDLLNKGLAFDSVAGNFELKNGDAHTTDFQIKGPSAQVDISGRTGLAREDFDQLVTVTPHLSAALPVAGLLAGGPVGGAAMLLAQGLIGKEFDKASKRQYQVKGAWSDPVLTPLSADKMAVDAEPVKPEKPVTKVTTESAVAGSVEQDDANLPDTGATGLFDALKKQFTPTPRIHQEDREGGILGSDP